MLRIVHDFNGSHVAKYIDRVRIYSTERNQGSFTPIRPVAL